LTPLHTPNLGLNVNFIAQKWVQMLIALLSEPCIGDVHYVVKTRKTDFKTLLF